MEERLYSTAEIMMATGMERGTITNRAKKLGFERNGYGYTAEQVMRIMLQPLESHRKSEEAALELREILNRKIQEMGLPMGIVENENGKWCIAYRAGEKRKIVPRGQEAYRKKGGANDDPR